MNPESLLRKAQALGEDIKEMESIDVLGAYQQAQTKIKINRRRSMYNQLMRYAAFLTIPLLLSSLVLGYLYWGATDAEEKYAEVVAATGSIIRYELPDHSVVWLNSGSTLRYPTVFKKDNRNVELKGEAYFEVAHNKRAPFIVNSKQIKTCVLGTKFNVRARNEENRVVTTLLQGLVRVDSPRTEDNGYLLKPGQTLNVNTDTYQAELIEYNQPTDVLLWINGKLMFKQHSLLEITNVMEKLYDIKFVYEDDALKTERFTGEFSTDSTPDEILNVLMHTNHFNYKKNGRVIRLIKKK